MVTNTSMHTNLLADAIQIAKFWPIFPVIRHGDNAKKPYLANGFKGATQDEATIREWWRRWPEADIAIPTGAATGLLVIDIDPRHGGDDSLEDLRLNYGPLPDSVEAVTQSGGQHLYYQWDGRARNAVGILPGIDVRGEGGYVVVPPSLGPSGQGYVWESSSHPEERPLCELPIHFRNGRIATNRLTNGSGGNLNGFVPGVGLLSDEPAMEGTRNQTLARWIGRWLTDKKSLLEISRLAHEWNEANNRPPLPKKEVDATVHSIITTHFRNHPSDEVIVENVESDEKPVRTKRTEHLEIPTHLLTPPGIVGEICQYINDTSPKPQPVLALGNTLAFFGAMIGRKVRTPHNLRSNIYAVGIAPSSAGKGHSMKCIKNICDEAGVATEKIIERIASDSGLVSAVKASPAVLIQIDEFGKFASGILSENAGAHDKRIIDELTKMWSAADQTFYGKEYADREKMPRIEIVEPCVCMYGATIPERFEEHVTPSHVSDGFIPRILLFWTDTPDQRFVEPQRLAIPKTITATVQAWFKRENVHPPGIGNLDKRNYPTEVPLDDDARRHFAEFREKMEETQISSRILKIGLDSIWGRTWEQAIRIALIVACGKRFDDTVIDLECAKYSTELAEALTRRSIYWVKNNVAENEYHRRLQKVLTFIADAGQDGVKKNNLARRFNHIEPRYLKEITDSLILSSSVAFKKVPNGKARPYEVFIAVDDEGTP